MRQLYLIFCFISFSVFAQNYQPFNVLEKKIFSTYPLVTSAYSASFDSLIYNAADTLYYNFFDFNLYGVGVPSTCPWWAPPFCYPQNVQEWLGSKIKRNGNNFTLYNISNDSLQFDFSIAIGDTSVIYQDSAQRFSMIYIMLDTVNVLSYTDSAKYYSVLHTDLSGNSINSILNGKSIVISKDAGLIRFFQIDSFPQVLRPLQLVSSNVVGGITAMTGETLYDYQPGDEIQYHIAHSQNPGPPWGNYSLYELYSIISKTVTADSIFYNAARTFFYVDSSFVINDTVTLKYARFDTIASIPFELHDESVNRLYLINYCGTPLWTFERVPDLYYAYCPQERCWGPIDTGGPLPVKRETYVEGLGAYNLYESLSQPGNSFFEVKEIVYFKKNGMACDTPVVQSVFEHAIDNIVKIYPVPAFDKINIETSTTVKEFSVIDMCGRVVLEKDVNDKTFSVGINILNSGIYTAKIVFNDKTLAIKKIVVSGDQ